MAPRRRLVHVPIVHTAADFGSSAAEIREAHVTRHGEEGWAARERAVAELWSRIRERALSLAIDYRRLRIYQDGLPRCGYELEIVRQLAEAGSENHRLLLELVERGARLVGTEDPELLLEERERFLEQKEALVRGESPAQTGYDRLLERRDEHIARTIDRTLKPDEVGMLFIGGSHRVAERVPEDIRVEELPARDGGEGES